MSCREVWLWPRLGLLQTCWPQAFLRRLREEEPDDVMISPECRLWSRLQELTANKSPKALQFLVDARQENHDTHTSPLSLWCTKRSTELVDIRQLSIRGTQEHGRHELWLSSMVLRLMWINANLDLNLKTIKGKCYQYASPHVSSQPGRMSTMTWVSMSALVTMSTLHVKVTFQDKVEVQSLLKIIPGSLHANLHTFLTQEDEIGDDIDAAIDADEELHQLEREGQELALPEEREAEIIAIKSNKQLKLRVGARAVDYVARLHKNMGHPSAATLVKMLAEVQATENVLEAARKYVCRSCYHRAKPFQVPPSGGISSTTFGNRLVVDSSWIQLGPDRQCILAMVDEATRYTSLFTSWLLRNPPTS